MLSRPRAGSGDGALTWEAVATHLKFRWPAQGGLARNRGHRSTGRRDNPEIAEFTRKGHIALAAGDGLMPGKNVSSYNLSVGRQSFRRILNPHQTEG